MNVSFLSAVLVAKRKSARVRSICFVVATVSLLIAGSINQARAQNDVFWRSASTTGLWWAYTAKPWFYYGVDQARPDFGFNNNRLFIGNNTQTTMTVNGAFFDIGSLTIESDANQSRTFNSSSGGGISFRTTSAGFTNASTASQTFNVPIGINVGTVLFRANNGSANTSFTGDFYLNGNTANFGGSSDTTSFTLSGTVSGSSGQIVKQDSNFLILSGNNGYAGGTGLTAGTITVNTATALGTASLTATGGTSLVAGVSGLNVGNAATLLAGNLTVDSGAGTFQLSGVISGAGSLTKINSGNLTLSGVNT
jgi:autotransporter-associated beta strand protein